jgi:uncharacterized protein (DUF1800 family)
MQSIVKLCGDQIVPLITEQMSMNHASANLLLLSRAGFGPSAEDIRKLGIQSPRITYRNLRKASSAQPEYFKVSSNMLDGLVKGIQDVGKMEQLSKEQRAQIRKQSQQDLKSLNLRWIREMVNSPAQLREKMAFFWHGHFACREINIYFQQHLLDIIRRNALGNFGELLREVSKSASMLSFLNNQQNRKQQPNENFAREVMELFTMGRGNYTEQDIKEAARAFTGWGFNLQGEFVFRKNLHDEGVKTVLGRTGNLNGDDVLNILLEERQTARYLAAKIYRFFVNEKADAAKVQWLAERFYKNKYDISVLLEDIFTSDWFYEDNNLGAKIKSPIELMVGIQRILPMEFEQEEVQLLYQRLLGQVLFYPPNVAGWPGGENWIDSSSLMYRLRLPRVLHDDDHFNAKPKDDDDVAMGERMESSQKQLVKNTKATAKGVMNVDINWMAYVSQFAGVDKTNLPAAIASSLLTVGQVNLDTIHAYTEKDSRENYIRSLTIGLMSLPEYQVS